MLSEEEKAGIAERLAYEAELRKSLSGEPRRAPWWEGKLFLLVAGAVLTGILVPIFQCSQSTLTWRRQNRYEAIQAKIGSMRDCLAEFGKVPAYLSQAYEEARPIIEGTDRSQEAHKAFKQRFAVIQAGRFEQNAKVSSLLAFFDDGVVLASDFREYTSLGSARIRLIEKAVDLATAAKPLDDLRKRLDAATVQGDERAEGLMLKMKNAITEAINESDEFR